MKFGPFELSMLTDLKMDIKYFKDEISYKGKIYKHPFIRLVNVNGFNRETRQFYCDYIELSFRGQSSRHNKVRFRVTKIKNDEHLEENLQKEWDILKLEML